MNRCLALALNSHELTPRSRIYFYCRRSITRAARSPTLLSTSSKDSLLIFLPLQNLAKSKKFKHMPNLYLFNDPFRFHIQKQFHVTDDGHVERNPYPKPVYNPKKYKIVTPNN
jgi:hypothetical protein